MSVRIKMLLMFPCWRILYFFVLIILPFSLLFWEGSSSVLLGACVEQSLSEPRPDIFQRHFSKGCAASGGVEVRVSASELLDAIQAGKSIDLQEVVIQGDVVFDQFPTLVAERLNTLRQDRVEVREGVKSDQVRLIAQKISIQRSRFAGVVGTSLKQGDLIVQQPLLLTDNIFEGPVDFSRTLFLEDVNFSSSHFLQGGFFVQARFHGLAQFDHGQFGERARYHKSHFYDSAHFSHVQFSGMTEFLEVLFKKDSHFTQSVFKLGAGFSGAHFEGIVDFSRGTFQREAFFLYTIFDQQALFTESNFQGPVTFDRSQFNGLDDFSSATFAQGSPFAKEPLRPKTKTSQEPLGPLVAYGISFALILAFGVKLLIDRKKKRR